MDLLNNRELALAVWAVLLIALAATKPDLRMAFGGVVRAFAQWLILVPLALMICYIVLVVWALAWGGIWDVSQLKNTILWGVSVAAVLLFRVVQSVSAPQFRFIDFCKTVILDNLQLVAVLEFVVAFYTFPLLVEIVTVPIAALIAMARAYASSRAEHALVAKLLDHTLAIFGGGLIFYAGYQIAVSFSSFATLATLTDFTLPPMLSVIFLPFLFLAGLFASYDNAFARLKFAMPDPSLRSYARWRAILGFHLRTALLSRWTRNVMLAKPTDRQAVDRSIGEVKLLGARERAPAEVSHDRGWSPYVARCFLEAEGFQLGDYHRAFGESNEWFASSPYQEFGEGILPNNIAYYVEGDEFAATTLKLVMNVNEPQAAQDARRKFTSAAKLLHEKALHIEMPPEIEQCLTADTSVNATINGKTVVGEKVAWPRHRVGGFEMRFLIRNSIPSGSGTRV